MRNDQCDLCSLGINSPKRPRSICLIGDPARHQVMVVGEVPGGEDDLHNQLFVSPGFRDCKNFLSRHGVDAYYAFAVKCRKPELKTKLTPKHVKTCATEYLKREIEMVQPEHIIVLGAKSYYAVTGKSQGFEAAQGTRFFDSKVNAWIYPTYHPAQVLFDRAKKDPWLSEMRMFLKWIQEGADAVKFDPPIYTIDTIDGLLDLQNEIRRRKNLAGCDTETDRIYPYGNGQMRCIQFCYDPKVGGFVIPLHLEPDCFRDDPSNVISPYWQREKLSDAVEIIAQILRESRIVWHNGKFDRLWLHEWGWRNFGCPIVAPHIAMDTMHVAFLLNENIPALSLKKLIISDLNLPSYNIPNKLSRDLNTLFPYAGKDTVGMMLLAQKYATDLTKPDNARIKAFYSHVLKKADAAYTRMELRGWPIDPERCRDMIARLESRFDVVTDLMFDWLKENGVTDVGPEIFASKAFPDFIYDRLHIPENPNEQLARSEKTNERSVSEDALSHVQKHPFVKRLFARRKLAKLKSTYAEPMLSQALGRGSLTTAYKLAKAVTGRTASGKENKKQPSSEGMNLQNLSHPYKLAQELPEAADPNDPFDNVFDVKFLIKSSNEDLWMWSVDLSQIELVIAAQLSRDKLLLDTFRNGGDLHEIRAARVMGITLEEFRALAPKVYKDKRTKAKPVNFGYLYGMSAPTFQTFALTTYKIEFTMRECHVFRDSFFSDHTGLEPWYGRVERDAKAKGYVETLSGRRRRLPNLELDPRHSKDYSRLYRDAVRQAINSPVQGFGSDLKLFSVIEIDEWLEERFGGEPYGTAWQTGNRYGYGGEWNNFAYQIGEVHDAINGMARRDVIEEVVHNAVRIMKHPRLLDVLGIEMDVPISAEAEIGPSYGELFKVETA